MLKLENQRRASTQCPWCKSRNAMIWNGVFHCLRCSYQQDISAPPEIRVIGWTTADDPDYLEFDCRTAAIYDAIVNEIREKEYSFSWGAHQSNQLPCTPIINNGFKICCGPRTWGSMMAEAHGSDGVDDSAYAAYAFCAVEDPIYPKKSVDHSKIIPFEIGLEE